MTISQDLKGKIYHKAQELKELLKDMQLVYLPLQKAIRKLGWVDEQKFREEIGEELRELVNFNHKRANKIIQKADKLLREIHDLLEGKE